MAVVDATMAVCRKEGMGEACTGERASGMIRSESGPAARGAADWLCLAAAPTFAIMALLTGVSAAARRRCSASAASPLSGMTPMYLLMSAFHSAPWLELISGRRRSSTVQPRSNNACIHGEKT